MVSLVFERGHEVFTGRLFPEARPDVDEEQQTQNYQNRAKTYVKPFPDRHRKMPPLPPATRLGENRSCRFLQLP